MTVNELMEYLVTLDGDMEVEIGDSQYPSEELKKDNISIQNGRVLLY